MMSAVLHIIKIYRRNTLLKCQRLVKAGFSQEKIMAGTYLDRVPANLKVNAIFNLYFFLWYFSDTIQTEPITDLGEMVTESFVGLMILTQWVFPGKADK